ncbi:MAG TPA: PLP-dependent aminotransferase family protein [Kofleriaceae bacterium]|nr:PLP-dependent aminotransferase family protein [Kofleriaceae bacterium]
MRAVRPYQSDIASLLIRLDPRSDAPLYAQIFDGVRARILAGELARGARLPSSRQLAADLRVSRATVLQAFDALAAEGYITALAQSSTRVALDIPDDLVVKGGGQRDARASNRTLRLSRIARSLRALPTGAPRLAAAPRAFRPGIPALDMFPIGTWSRVVARCHARASVAALDGGDPAGDALLRESIAAHVTAARGVRCEGAQVFVTGGTQLAIDEILRLVIDPGDAVWVENPGYLGTRRAVITAGGRLAPIPVDADGLDVDAGIARAPRARAVILSPSHHYPLGVTLSLPRRMALLRWARRARAIVFEDDYDSEFRHRGRPLMALQGLDDTGHTVYVGTFSKTLFPGLRIGFAVVPPGLVDVVAAARASAAAPASALDQAAVATFIADGHFARHVRRMRRVYEERSQALVDAVASECGGMLEPRPSDSGMQLWAALRVACSDVAVRDAAAQRGIEVAALSSYFVGRARMRGLVFGFGALRPTALRAGVQRLARAIEDADRTRAKPRRG